MMIESLAARANTSGIRFEKRVEQMLTSVTGLDCYLNSEWGRLTGTAKDAPKYIKEFPFVNPHNDVILRQVKYFDGRGENEKRFRDLEIRWNNKAIHVELKYQDSSGSAAEKPYLTIDNIGRSSCDCGVVVLEGDYWRYKKKDKFNSLVYDAKKQSQLYGKEILVLYYDEFISYILSETN